LNYLTVEEAIAHASRGAGIWGWASNDNGEEPDVVLACAGAIPTLEPLAAAANVSMVGTSPAQASTTSGSSPSSLLAQGQMPAPWVQCRIASSIGR